MPDVVLLDISIPEMNGLEVARQVGKVHPEVRVIILSMHATEGYVWRAMKSGALGYVLKEADAHELELAIKTVLSGKTFVSPAITQHLFNPAVTAVPPELLPRRMRQVLLLIAQGHTNKEIAHELTLSVKTIETHRARGMKRLGVRDTAGLIRWAIAAGETSLEV